MVHLIGVTGSEVYHYELFAHITTHLRVLTETHMASYEKGNCASKFYPGCLVSILACVEFRSVLITSCSSM